MELIGAGNETRTRDPNLGKVALHQYKSITYGNLHFIITYFYRFLACFRDL